MKSGLPFHRNLLLSKTTFPSCLGAFLITAVVNSAGQTTPVSRPAGIISGRVVIAGSSTGIEGAVVRLFNLEPAGLLTANYAQESNERGEFRFADLPQGRYELTATRSRYLPVIYGQIQPGSGGPGVSIWLANGQHMDGLSVSMPLPAVIAGMVTDSRGEPAQGSSVHLLRYEWVAGQRTLRDAGQDVVDDRGSYRIPGLRPGEYLVSASLRTNRNPGDPPPPAQIFYPGTPLIQSAQSLVVEAGDEKAADIQLRVVHLASVGGSVIFPEGRRFEGARLTAVNTATAWIPMPGITQFDTYTFDRTGKFMFSNLAPGRYQVTATSREDPSGPDTEFWAMTDIQVGADDLTDVKLTLQRGSTLSGEIVVDPTKPRATTSGTVFLQPLDAGRRAFPAMGRLGDAGQFTIAGIIPGRYALRFTLLPPGVFISSMRVAGRDATDQAIDVGPSEDVREVKVRMTDVGSAIVGRLLDASGQPTPDYLVVVFPVDEKYWLSGTRRIRTTRPGSDGQYVFRSLPPGEYRLAALTDAEPDEWSAPSFLRKIGPSSVAVTIAEGETKTLDVRIR
jgi:uncharacterized protein (DUF2141 family)